MNSLYDLDLNTFHCKKVKTKGEPIARGYHSASLINRFILIYAGYNGKYILGDLITLDTEKLVWSLPDPCLGHFPPARNAHTMTMIGSELFMFGGYNGTRDTNDLYILETAAFSTLQDDLKQGISMKIGKTQEIRNDCYSLYVHSAILKARCPKLLENKSPLKVCKEALDLFVEYLYCDLLYENINQKAAKDLVCLATWLDLPHLMSICENDFDNSESSLVFDFMSIKNCLESSDFVIEVQQKEFFVHNIVLATRCPYFKAMFLSGMAENSQNRLELKHFSSEAFEYVIE